MAAETQIQSPRGIRFDCSGCANCCMHWPVPINQTDYDRISQYSGPGGLKAEMRSLKSSRESLISFTHTLEKQPDGSCIFLNQEKRCTLHIEHGAAAKPSMCRLFPYTFMVTPDEVLASLSFASSAVLFNTGTLLSEQAETLQTQYAIFESLFKPKVEVWQRVQLIDGVEISWEKLKPIDQEIMSAIHSGADANSYPRKIIDRLKSASDIVACHLPDPTLAERSPQLEARPKIVDQIILKHLDRLYFPEQVFGERKYDLDARALLTEIVAAPDAVSFGQGKYERKFSDLIKQKVPRSDEIDDLIDRFFYIRIFSKMYFGPGFHHLSLLSGLNHLRAMYILFRLKMKHLLCTASGELTFELSCELVRTLERRLTQLDLSRESLSLLEVLLASPSRQDRMRFLAD